MDNIARGELPPETQAFPQPAIQAPPEVKIRTMESDTEAIIASGGTLGRPEGIVSPSTSSFISKAPFTQAQAPASPVNTRRFMIALTVFGIIGGIIILSLIGYFIIFPIVSEFLAPVPGENPSGALPGFEPSVQSSPNFTHSSFFRIPPDGSFKLTFESEPAQSVEELKTYAQRLGSALASVDATSGMLEVEIQGKDGSPLAFNEFLSLTKISLFDPDFLRNNFNEDFTAFVFKDSKGSWPGYVLRLGRGLTQLLVRDQVAALEGSPDLANLFLTPPGRQALSGFRDGAIAGKPVRYVLFSNSTEGTPVAFYYSWFNNSTLVLSTSEEALKKAFEHLGR